MAEDKVLLEYRVTTLESTSKDHEHRLRVVEALAIKIGVWAFIGAILGGALVAAVANRLTGG